MIKETYYADEWMDEHPGVAGDLDTVAKQMAHGVEHEPGTWIVPPQSVPSKHDATRIRYHYVACKQKEDGTYTIPLDLPGEIHAIAHYKGGGWGSEMLMNTREEAIADLNLNGYEKTEWLVCRSQEVRGVLHLLSGPIAKFEPIKQEAVT